MNKLIRTRPFPPWQIATAERGKLRTIVLPLEPQPEKQDGLWYWRLFEAGGGICWCDGERNLSEEAKHTGFFVGDSFSVSEDFHCSILSVHLRQFYGMSFKTIVRSGLDIDFASLNPDLWIVFLKVSANR